MIGFISGFVFEGLPGLFIKVYKFRVKVKVKVKG